MGKRRSPFTIHEEDAIIEGVKKLGEGKWKEIKLRHADVLKRRSGTDIKNHYFGHLARADQTTSAHTSLDMSMVFRYLMKGLHTFSRFLGVLSNDCSEDCGTVPMATLDTSATESMMAYQKSDNESWRSDLATLRLVYFLMIPFLQLSINLLFQVAKLRLAGPTLPRRMKPARRRDITILHHMSFTPQKRSFDKMFYKGLLCDQGNDSSEYRICKDLKMGDIMGRHTFSMDNDNDDDNDYNYDDNDDYYDDDDDDDDGIMERSSCNTSSSLNDDDYNNDDNDDLDMDSCSISS
mmetsp:Transcript_59250/g.70701  ORF Transcript_59250/g.70701 Transcript_59250/m.70701 type:complete len:293 (-) Transcript_59250:3-881(-)